MEARYLTNENGERVGVVLEIEEYERLRRAAEEAARMVQHPGIAFRGPEGCRRAWVVGTGFDVWEIVAGYEKMGRERVLEESTLSEDQLNTALSYYEAHPKEIDEMVSENNPPLEYWRERHPDLDIEVIEH